VSELNERIEYALGALYGEKEAFRPLLDPENVLRRICRTAAFTAKSRGVEPWSIIGDITGHGSGVSNAIYRVYSQTPAERVIELIDGESEAE